MSEATFYKLLDSIRRWEARGRKPSRPNNTVKPKK